MKLLDKLRRAPAKISKKLQLSRHYGYPYSLQIVPSNACNLRCMQCPKTWYETDNQHLNPKVYERVREELFPRVRELNLQGLGEPMMSPLFGRILDDALEHRLRVRFVTNTSFFREEYLDKLMRLDACVTFSIDGAKPQTHEASRPGNDLRGVLAVIEILAAEKAKYPQSQFAMTANTVITTENVDELDAIFDYLIRFGIKAYSINNPGVGPRRDKFALAAIGNHTARYNKVLPGLIAKARQHGIAFVYPVFADTIEDPAAADTAPAPAAQQTNGRLFPGKCFDPWDSVYVDVDGWVRPCCRAIWVGMGNILTESFDSIWNNPDYRKLRGSVNSNNPPSFCRDCNTAWGINRGDERYVEKLTARGITLPDPPQIGKLAPKTATVVPAAPAESVEAATEAPHPESGAIPPFTAPKTIKPWTRETPLLAARSKH